MPIIQLRACFVLEIAIALVSNRMPAVAMSLTRTIMCGPPACFKSILKFFEKWMVDLQRKNKPATQVAAKN